MRKISALPVKRSVWSKMIVVRYLLLQCFSAFFVSLTVDSQVILHVFGQEKV